jgi:site-specific DNA-methyltransferase (adenine-specific)
MPDNFIDLTVTSPPYDNLRDYNGYVFEFEDIAKELYRVTKEGGVVVWLVNDATENGSETGTSFRQALYFKEIGFNIHDTMIWHKDFGSSGNRYFQWFEYMFVFSKGSPKTFNPIMDVKNNGMNKQRNRSDLKRHKRDKKGNIIYSDKSTIIKEYRIRENIWFYGVGYNKTTNDVIAFKHPAIFPEQLANDHIISWSSKNDLIYDPFMGSGTTAKMAIENNRNWIGSEISSKYCKIIEKRIKNIQVKFKEFT